MRKMIVSARLCCLVQTAVSICDVSRELWSSLWSWQLLRLATSRVAPVPCCTRLSLSWSRMKTIAQQVLGKGLTEQRAGWGIPADVMEEGVCARRRCWHWDLGNDVCLCSDNGLNLTLAVNFFFRYPIFSSVLLCQYLLLPRIKWP